MEHIRVREVLFRDAILTICANDNVCTEEFASCERDCRFLGIDSGDSCVESDLGAKVGGCAI